MAGLWFRPILTRACEQDVTRLIEQEVKEIETLIRHKYKEAAFIELEPDSKKSYLRASDGKAWQKGGDLAFPDAGKAAAADIGGVARKELLARRMSAEILSGVLKNIQQHESKL